MTKTNDNPLSNARKQQKGRSADEIWYRKAGLGYRCFLIYYATILLARQDHEVEAVPPIPIPMTTPHTPADNNEALPKRPSTTAGMSRAAKRRRKRKIGNVITTCLEARAVRPDQPSAETIVGAEATSTTTTPPPQATADPSFSMMKNDIISNHPLYRAWIELGKPPSMESFVRALCRPLPVTVRVRANLLDQEKKHVGSVLTTHPHGFQVVTEDIYQLPMSKGELSKELQQLLTDYQQSGKIARQELGSMLPVRLLAQLTSPSYHHVRRILDICASPGSKTLQALEVFDSSKTSVIANDINAHRLEQLRDAVHRSGMAETIRRRIQYTNQDATKFKLYATNSKTNNNNNNETTTTTNLAKFRIILCDVPCSGDGTSRKDPSILPQWKPSIGNNLHSVQLAILRRSLLLLKPGGYLCYSTCSMYPIENEAVVAAALAASHNNDNNNEEEVVLVDCPKEATRGFHLEPGLAHWTVAGRDDDDDAVEDDTGVILFESYHDALERSPDSSWSSSMWPPSILKVTRQLHRCRRLWPHHQDSGGFFVALFHKTKQQSTS